MASAKARHLHDAVTDILQRVNALSSLLNFATNDLRNQLRSQLRECTARSFALNDLHHLFADRTDLRRGSVCSFFYLIWPSLGKCDGEEAQKVIIGGFDGDVGFDERLPFTYERS